MTAPTTHLPCAYCGDPLTTPRAPRDSAICELAFRAGPFRGVRVGWHTSCLVDDATARRFMDTTRPESERTAEWLFGEILAREKETGVPLMRRPTCGFSWAAIEKARAQA